MVLKKIDYIRVAIITAIMLVIPLAGNVFVNGWAWGPLDFVFAAVMLFGTGLSLVYAGRKFATPAARFIACSIIVFLFLTVWAQMAVGII